MAVQGASGVRRAGATDSVDGRQDLGAAAVGRPQIVPPVARRLCELMYEFEGVWSELRPCTLVESGVVAPPAQHETPYVRRTPRESKYSMTSPSPDTPGGQ